MTPAGAIPRELQRLQRPAIVCAAIGAVLMLIGLPFFTEQVFRAYLIAWLLVLGISLGGLAIVMLGHLVPGEWSWLIRRFGEAAGMNLIVVAILFIPILFGLKLLYPWAQPETVAHDHILQHKAIWLNKPWFMIRAAIYFAVWIFLASRLRKESLEHDRTGGQDAINRAQRFSAGGLVAIVITMSLASVDWILSRDPHWFSSILGFAVVVGQGLSGMAFMTLLLMMVAGRDPVVRVLEKRHMNDLGNLLLTLVILWAYMSFVQFLVIWMGNVQEDSGFYIERGIGQRPNGWRWLGLFLVVFHFFVPFLILLSRYNKRRVEFLRTLALWLIVMRVLDLVWMIAPTGGRGFTWMLFPALLALGGIWLAAYVGQLRGKPLLPAHSPMLDAQAHGAEGSSTGHGDGHGDGTGPTSAPAV